MIWLLWKSKWSTWDLTWRLPETQILCLYIINTSVCRIWKLCWLLLVVSTNGHFDKQQYKFQLNDIFDNCGGSKFGMYLFCFNMTMPQFRKPGPYRNVFPVSLERSWHAWTKPGVSSRFMSMVLKLDVNQQSHKGVTFKCPHAFGHTV